MGQRSQFYVSFPLRNEEVEQFTGAKDRNLSALHLQWCWGWYMLQRAKQLLHFIKTNIENDSYSEFAGKGFDKARETRQSIYNLTELNLETCSICKGIDLVKEKIYFAFDRGENESWEDYQARFHKYLLDDKQEKKYSINPLEQDNNDGFFTIKIEDDGTIKYAFDRCDREIKPLTAQQYYCDSRYEDEEDDTYKKYDYEHFDEEEKRYVEDLIKYIDDNFTLMTKEEVEEIFNQEYTY